MGGLLLALVFFASGAAFLKDLRTPRSAETPARGFAAMPANRKAILAILLLVMGVLVLAYWAIGALTGG